MKCVHFFFILVSIAISSCQNENTLIGDKYFVNGQYDKAIESYNDYLKLKPKHVKTIYNRGRCYQELGQYDKALTDFIQVINIDAHNENALLSIGQEMYRKEDYESTTFYGDKVLQRDPNNAMAYYLKGRAKHKQGLIRDALHNYTFAINLSPDLGEAYLHRGALKLYLKQNRGACDDLRTAVSLNVEGASEALKKNCK
jgi:tetratricopeptide (TPR) repeat protein